MSGLAPTEQAAWVRVLVEGGSAQDRERALLAAVEAGASGGEERGGPQPALVVYAPGARGPAVHGALRALPGPQRVGPLEVVPEQTWSEAWKEGLEPIAISPRLVVTPSFRPVPARAGQRVLEIDPGQAFGTGGHASTRLALELLAALPEEALRGARALDVGCGTGVLALAALALGAGEAVALDLDPLATTASRENARRNGLEGSLRVFNGPVASLCDEPFSLVLANMIRSELFPVLPELARRCAPGGLVVVSGLLLEEEERAVEALGELGLGIAMRLDRSDHLGDHWLGAVAKGLESS
ncbi:MAG: 50S ribosomal protein L11 methyltransferase [Deltaproteobacteria bacterium]|jgi:ribosomal protein L11 methyltransferase|nr:50S ribosomal protein L11 methyltransferase [Deltaproteobacteria bacterium]